jgi:hypothetical protein
LVKCERQFACASPQTRTQCNLAAWLSFESSGGIALRPLLLLNTNVIGYKSDMDNLRSTESFVCGWSVRAGKAQEKAGERALDFVRVYRRASCVRTLLNSLAQRVVSELKLRLKVHTSLENDRLF